MILSKLRKRREFEELLGIQAEGPAVCAKVWNLMSGATYDVDISAALPVLSDAERECLVRDARAAVDLGNTHFCPSGDASWIARKIQANPHDVAEIPAEDLLSWTDHVLERQIDTPCGP